MILGSPCKADKAYQTHLQFLFCKGWEVINGDVVPFQLFYDHLRIGCVWSELVSKLGKSTTMLAQMGTAGLVTENFQNFYEGIKINKKIIGRLSPVANKAITSKKTKTKMKPTH